MKTKSRIAKGHNPDRVTVEQVGNGWRLLGIDEIYERSETNDIQLRDVMKNNWNGQGWCGSDVTGTYRTRKPKGFFLPKEDKPKKKSVGPNEWQRGYFCALALMLKADYGIGVHSPAIMEFFKSGGDYRNADHVDIATFRRHGLIK